MFEQIKKLAEISSRGGRVPPIYLYLVFIIPGFAYSITKTGQLNFIPFILVSIAIMPLIAATNLFDDYFDYNLGFDKKDSPNTIYRRHPIFHYKVTPNYLIRWAVVFSIIYLIFSLLISLKYGLVLNLIAVIGLALGYGYTGPPFGYKYLGLGEIGVLLSAIAASEFISVASIGRFYPDSVLFFLPFSFLIALILFLGNYRDLEFDQKSGFKTLATILGRRKSGLFSALVFTVFYGTIAILYFVRIYGEFSLIDFITAPFAYYLSFEWSKRDSSKFERFAGPYLFAILMLLNLLLIL